MNPIFTWIIADTVARTTVEMLTRKCPKCGRKQVVAKGKIKSEVPCERCGAPVPTGSQSEGRRS
jgi:endogenous inhibitor of DNA gyrase (YacG/DUF329 family)